jgi:hypothetical protein
MKKQILILFFIPFVTYSQQLTKSEFITQVSNKTCNCLNEKKEKISNLEAEIGICMLSSLSDHMDDFEYYYGENAFANEELMYNFGVDLGFKMVTICPDFFMNNIDTMLEIANEDESESNHKVFEGKILEIYTNQQLFSFTVKDKTGTIVTFILLENFESSYLLTEGLVSKKQMVEVEYYQKEIYDSQNKEFTFFNVVSSITIK